VSRPERRTLSRLDLELPAKVSKTGDGDSGALELWTSDVSAGGAFFLTGQPLPVGTELEIDLILPLDELKKLQGKNAHINLSGEVVRVSQKGMAVCFAKKYTIRPLTGHSHDERSHEFAT